MVIREMAKRANRISLVSGWHVATNNVALTDAVYYTSNFAPFRKPSGCIKRRSGVARREANKSLALAVMIFGLKLEVLNWVGEIEAHAMRFRGTAGSRGGGSG